MNIGVIALGLGFMLGAMRTGNIKPPDGKSTKEVIQKRFGDEGIRVCICLIGD